MFKGTEYTCSNCRDIISSKFPGDFVSCKCGQSYVDETFEYVRLGGLIMNDNRAAKLNKLATTFNDDKRKKTILDVTDRLLCASEMLEELAGRGIFQHVIRTDRLGEEEIRLIKQTPIYKQLTDGDKLDININETAEYSLTSEIIIKW